MEKVKAFFQKIGKKKIIIGCIVIAAIIGFVILGLYSKKKAEKAQERPQGTIDTIQMRAIANSISGTGVVDSEAFEEVTTDLNGYTSSSLKVTKVYVSEGDVVQAGDKICQFDTEDLVEQKEDSEDNLGTLKKRRQKTADNKVKQDEKYDKQIVKADKNRKKNMETCAKNYKKTQDKLAQAQIDAYTIFGEYNQAVAEYNQAVADYNAALDAYNNDNTNLQKQSAMNTAKGTMETKKTAVQTKKTQWDTKGQEIETYQEQLTTYEDQFAELWENDEAQEIRENKADYDDETDDQIAEYDDQISDTEKNIRETKEQIDACTVTCVSGGTVTAVNVKEKFTFNGSVVAVIEGVENFIVEAEINEYDIADVTLGMKALVKTDATRDAELIGTVSFIAPRATGSGENDMSSFNSIASGFDMSGLSASKNTSATYTVKISNLDYNDRLRLGMNCKVSILTNEEEKALSVPFDALQQEEDGTYYIEIVKSGESVEDEDFELEKVKVTLGIEGSYYVEVHSKKLEEGMKVFVPNSGNGTSIEDLLNNMGSDAGV